MTEEEELAERIAEEERNLKREKWVNFFIRAITIIIIGLVLMVIIENILDYREESNSRRCCGSRKDCCQRRDCIQRFDCSSGSSKVS